LVSWEPPSSAGSGQEMNIGEQNHEAADDLQESAGTWEAVLDDATGKTYYHNEMADMVSWEAPASVVAQQQMPEQKTVSAVNGAKGGTVRVRRKESSVMTAPLGILSAPLVTTRNGRKTARNWTTDAPTTKAGLSQERARRLSALIHMGEGDTLVGQAGDADELWNALRDHSVAHESNVAAHMHGGDGGGGGGGSGAGAGGGGAGAGGGAFEGRQQKSRPRRQSAAVQAGVLFERETDRERDRER